MLTAPLFRFFAGLPQPELGRPPPCAADIQRSLRALDIVDESLRRHLDGEDLPRERWNAALEHIGDTSGLLERLEEEEDRKRYAAAAGRAGESS